MINIDIHNKIVRVLIFNPAFAIPKLRNFILFWCTLFDVAKADIVFDSVLSQLKQTAINASLY